MRYIVKSVVLMVILLAAAIPSICAAVDVQLMTPKEAAKYVYDNIDDPHMQGVIDLMVEKIRKEAAPSVADELIFLTDVGNFDIKYDNKLKNVEKLQDILAHKYAGNLDATMQLLTKEMVFYRCVSPDQEKLATVIAQMDTLSIELQNRNVIVYLTGQVETGEAYLALPGGDERGPMREKARTYFQTVIDYPIFLTVYQPSYYALQKIYLRAAINLMSITNGGDLKKLWFSPFTYGEIARQFPEKSKYINSKLADPGRLKIEGTVSDWLRNRIVEAEKAEDPMLPHFKAVWDFLQQRNQPTP